jgi:hypothetical protein
MTNTIESAGYVIYDLAGTAIYGTGDRKSVV